jgi:misacylated tRNA(Ala) deacylase
MGEKEYDNRMHTAEHILNSVMDNMFGCGRSFKSHIETRKSKCDYHFDRGLTGEEIEAVQTAVNDIISKDIMMTEEFVTRSVAEANYFTGKLPVDSGDEIRIVKIGKYDACPCIGPHVRSTGEVGRFYFSTVDFDQNVLRMRFKLE